MRKLEYRATVSNDERAGLAFVSPAMEHGGRLYFKGKEIKVTYEIYKEHPSYLQYGYWFGVLVKEFTAILHDLGNYLTEDDAHDMLKLKFNPVHVVDKDGVIIETVGGSTKKLGALEFFDVMVQPARQWILDFFGVDIPEPDRDKLQQQINKERMKEKRKRLKENGNT